MERFDLRYDDRNVLKYGKMEPSSTGEWIRYSDLKQEGVVSVQELIHKLQQLPPDLLLKWNFDKIKQ